MLHREKHIGINRKNKKINLNKLLISFILAVILFVILINIEAGMLKNYEKTTVVRAKRDIMAGTEISKENLEEFFYLGEVMASQSMEEPVTKLNILENKVITDDLLKNEALSHSDIRTKDYSIQELSEPVEIAVKVTDLAEAVGGILRKGDRIDISVYDKETKECETILTNVCVQKALDQSGKEIDVYAKDSPATMINILIERNMQDNINEILEDHTIRIGKIRNSIY